MKSIHRTILNQIVAWITAVRFSLSRPIGLAFFYAVLCAGGAHAAVPVFTVGPSVHGVPSYGSVQFDVALDGPGNVAWFAVAAGAAVPTSAEVRALISYRGVTTIGGGLMSTGGGGSPMVGVSISGLSASTAYTAYFVAESGGAELQVAPTAVDFTTAAAPPDTTPPVLTSGPTITSGPTHNFAAYSVTYDEPGHIYAIVVSAAAAAPTAAQVKAMANYDAVTVLNHTDMPMQGNTAATLFASFPNPGTAYKVYFVAEDSVGNLQATPSNLDITTAAAPPTLIAGPTILSGPTHNFVTYSVTYDQPGHVYSIVVPAAAAAPTSTQVKAMVNYGAVTVLMTFDTTMLGNTAKTMMASFPSPSTAYTVYFVAEDSVGNLQAMPSSLNITTTAAPDVTPPALIAGPTIFIGPTSNSLGFSVTYDEPGSICSIVVPAAAAPPTAAQVMDYCLTGANYGSVTVLSAFFASMGGNVARMVFANFPDPSTAYTVYFVAKDSVGNLQASPSSLTVTTASAFAVTTISPSSGPTGGGTAITMTGTAFVNGATVTIGGAAATSVSWVSATSITATTPTGTVGLKDVVVTNPDTQSATLTSGFTYVGAPAVGLSPSSLTFTGQVVATTSAAKTVTLSNTGNATLTIASIATTSDYAVTHNCGAAVPAAGTCTVNVTFTPTAVGLRAGSLLINSNATGSPHGAGLSGTGLSPNQPVCTLSATPTSIRKNGTSVLASSCTNNPTAYSWTGGTCAGTTAPTCTVTPASTTAYSVTGTNGNGSSTASATVTVITGDITPILFLLLFD